MIHNICLTLWSRLQLQCEIFHWIPKGNKPYLVTDKTEAHGTGNAINQYTQILEEKNIEIIPKVPRSLETHLLDLGLWMTIQSSVQKLHCARWRTHTFCFAKSVSYAWNENLSMKRFKNVHGQFGVVLFCLVYGKGSNELVEKITGKFFFIPLFQMMK